MDVISLCCIKQRRLLEHRNLNDGCWLYLVPPVFPGRGHYRISCRARLTPVSRRVLLDLSVLESKRRIEIAGDAWFLNELQTLICGSSFSMKMFANFLKL